MRHDPRHHHANRRVSCSSGCVFGRPAPLPPLEKHGTVRNRTLEQRQRYQEGARLGWLKRRGLA
jgi:hypothetical protein